MEETMFYLTMCIYEKFNEYIHNERFMLIDLFYEEMKKLSENFDKVDNTNIPLLESVYDYINLHYDEIKEIIDKCSENSNLVF